MAYIPTNWVNGVTPENAANLNKIEAGIAAADAAAAAAAAGVAAKAELVYKGDWAAGTYKDGDVVVKDGIAFLCVGGDTAVAPDGTLWGSLGPIPAVQNGKWLKGSGGAMVWAPAAQRWAANTISAPNTDLAWGGGEGTVSGYISADFGGGSLRSIAAPPNSVGGELLSIRAGGGGFTLLHNDPAAVGAKLYLLGGVSRLMKGSDTILLNYSDGYWIEVAGSPTKGVISRNTTLVAWPNTVAEQSMCIHAIPAGAIGTDGVLRFVFNGSFRSQSTSDNFITYRLKLGGVTVWASIGVTYNNGAGTPDGEIFLEAFIQALGSQALQQLYGIIGASRDTMSTQVGMGKPSGSSMSPFGSGIADLTVNMALAQNLELTMQMSGQNNNNIVRHRSSFVELL